MTKAQFFLLTVFLSPIIGGAYGIVHDQVTFSICPEYYSKFKFYQFQIDTALQNRLGVAIVGVLATWWVGLFLGTVLGLFASLHRTAQQMKISLIRSFAIVLITTLLLPIARTTYWWISVYFQPVPSELYAIKLPSFVPSGIEISDSVSFYMVGMIHNYGYLGGLVGLVLAIVYHLYRKYKWNKSV